MLAVLALLRVVASTTGWRAIKRENTGGRLCAVTRVTPTDSKLEPSKGFVLLLRFDRTDICSVEIRQKIDAHPPVP